MNERIGARSRALVAAWGLVPAFLLAAAASAQTRDVSGPAPVDVITPAATSSLNQCVARAEELFRLGETALAKGRDAEARTAFDGALDVFVNMKGPDASDPRFLAAYRSLVDRILAAEVAADLAKQAAKASPTTEPSAANATVAAAEPQQADTLADLGARIETLTPTAEARQTNEAVLDREEIDLPIELNDQVLSAIDLYTGKFNKWFAAALSRGLPHLPRIRQILAEAGIPQDLAYVPIVESAFNPSALSTARARGLWQFIPSTGKQYGLKQDFFLDERSSVEKATVAAAQYLKNLYALFGDWNLALAGYNAGEGSVQRAMRRSQTNDFWALAKTRSFRAETKNYVPLIHAAIVIAKSPESYGIDVAPESYRAVEVVRVSGSYPITTVARCAKTEPGSIRDLNPELRRGMTPSSVFDLKVPSGSGGDVTACLATEKPMDFTRHVVRKRDTLGLISRMFGVPASEIARANGLTLQSRLRPGTELAIPRPPRTAPVKVAAAGKAAALPPDTYRIQQGDTLSSVAARHGTTVEAIKALNGLSSSRLSIGQVLRITSSTNSSSPE